jgi:hypothetical protein
MIEARTPRDRPARGANPQKKVGEESVNPLPDDYEKRHPEDDEEHSDPRAAEE